MSFKLFDKWDVTEVTVEDMGLQNYVCLDEIVVPHTMGRHVKRQFAKSKVSIVERLMNKIMRTERNSGKKNKAYSIVEDALEIINNKTKQNPVQVLVKAVENTAPREEIRWYWIPNCSRYSTTKKSRPFFRIYYKRCNAICI